MEGAQKTPRSFIFEKGEVGETIKTLVKDLRWVMSPHTAVNLKVFRANKALVSCLKLYQRLFGRCRPLWGDAFPSLDRHRQQHPAPDGHVSSRSDATLSCDQLLDCLRCGQAGLVTSLRSLSPAHPAGQSWLESPLVVCNRFTESANHVQLMSKTFQNLFPAINIKKVVSG